MREENFALVRVFKRRLGLAGGLYARTLASSIEKGAPYGEVCRGAYREIFRLERNIVVCEVCRFAMTG
ncbi:MAG TPA: hypothetical protein VJT50_07420, partial [Pyrinomonadaceae bacterium]|nr:hypothetical protein [Pyrinomonadaceae bacterium]